MLTQAELKSQLLYYKDTGMFIWLKLGNTAGYVDKDGYRIIKLNQKSYRAHRLAWFYVYGVWPSKQIDHIDNNKLNNAISNLREATQSQQNANRPALNRNLLGIKGIRKHGKKYQALICKDKKQIVIGLFDTVEEADYAYRKKALELYGEYCYE